MSGYTALHVAAEQDEPGAVELLLKAGADRHLANNEWSQTPLALAAECGHLRVAQLLLEIGADPHTSEELASAWRCAELNNSKNDKLEIMQLLREASERLEEDK